MVYRVLHMEDDLINIGLVKEYLRHLDIRLRSTLDGNKGLRIVRETTPQLVIVAMNLSTITGLDVIAHLKTDAATQHIPIIALTGSTAYLTRTLCDSFGVEGHVKKPIRRSILVSAVQSFLFSSPAET